MTIVHLRYTIHGTKYLFMSAFTPTMLATGWPRLERRCYSFSPGYSTSTPTPPPESHHSRRPHPQNFLCGLPQNTGRADAPTFCLVSTGVPRTEFWLVLSLLVLNRVVEGGVWRFQFWQRGPKIQKKKTSGRKKRSY